MGKPLSMDLRSRTLAAIDEGMSCRAAAARFGVAPSTAVRWRDQQRRTGSYVPKPQGGDKRSGVIEAHQAAVFALYEARRDITLDELRHALAEDGVVVAVSTLHRFFVRRGSVSVSPTLPCGAAADVGFAPSVIGGGGGWIWTRGHTTVL